MCFDERAFLREVYYDGLLVGTLLFEDVVVLEDDRAALDHWVHGFEQDFHALNVESRQKTGIGIEIRRQGFLYSGVYLSVCFFSFA